MSNLPKTGTWTGRATNNAGRKHGFWQKYYSLGTKSQKRGKCRTVCLCLRDGHYFPNYYFLAVHIFSLYSFMKSILSEENG